MSWFTSLFTPPPLSTPIPPAPQENRVLEEPAPYHTPIPPSTQAETLPQQTLNPNRNKIIFSAGLTFFAFSLLITRRAFTRRHLASRAAFYTHSPAHHAEQSRKTSPAMEAFEALNIATVNVLSVGMMATGGVLWYLDINSLGEARRFIRGGLGVDGTGRGEGEVEEEFEEWVAQTLKRKEGKEEKRKGNGVE